MLFSYDRTIHFQDTDAAGVVYFANVLSICHEAYEASLAAAGVDLKGFFRNPELAIPITHAQVDFFRPMFCGETYQIVLTPQLLKPSEFEIHYEAFLATGKANDQPSAKATTRHVCIDPGQRQRVEAPAFILQWLDQRC